MKKLTMGWILSLLISTMLMATEATTVAPTATADSNHVRVFTADNTDGKITAKSIQAAFEKAGFMVEANNDMNEPFKRDCKRTVFDVYNLMVLWRKDTALALAEKYPKFGLFTPLSMSIYTRKGDKTISVSSITPAGLAAMVGIDANEQALIDLGKNIEAALKSAMPNGKFVTLPYKMKAPEGPLVAEASFPAGDDWEETKDDLQMKFEEGLALNGFVSPAFVDLNYDFDEHEKDWYTFYDAYSICKIRVIFTVSQLHPEAGAFAPCTMFMYLKKDDNTIHMGFPTVHKWISALNITDKESLDVLMDAQKKYEGILARITGKEKAAAPKKVVDSK